jgi:glycosyltransferase involved in cell wall biosynthesis
VVVLGRALHAPWNEGTRVLGRSVAELASTMRPTRIVSLTNEEFRGADGAGVPVEHVYTNLDYGPRAEWASMRSLARSALRGSTSKDADVAHIIGLPLALAPVLRRAGMRVVNHITLSEHVYAGRVEALRAALAWRVFDRWVDAYAATSRPVLNALDERGLPSRNLHVVPTPIDTAVFRRRDRAEARASLGIDQKAFAVIYVGTVSPLRFPAPDIAAALVEAGRDVPDLSLDVFAPVRTHDYNLTWAEENVRKAADESGAPIRVHLEDLDDDRKAMVYSAADVVVVPFTAAVAVEPPLTLVEAMSCGAIVAASPQANRSALVRHGETGMTFEDAGSLAARLRELAALGRDGRLELGDRAQRSITTTHGPQAVADSLSAVWTAVGR